MDMSVGIPSIDSAIPFLILMTILGMNEFLIQRGAAKGQASKPVKLQSPGKGHRVQSLLERGHGRPVLT
jgi:hypothetical protein